MRKYQRNVLVLARSTYRGGTYDANIFELNKAASKMVPMIYVPKIWRFISLSNDV